MPLHMHNIPQSPFVSESFSSCTNFVQQVDAVKVGSIPIQLADSESFLKYIRKRNQDKKPNHPVLDNSF